MGVFNSDSGLGEVSDRSLSMLCVESSPSRFGSSGSDSTFCL